jgi:hypothetical protein
VTTRTLGDLAAASARAAGPTADAVGAVGDALERGLRGRQAAVVLWFASAAHDAQAVAGPLAARFPDAVVLGCSTAGEFTESGTGTGGISAVALPRGAVVRAVAALAELDGGVAAGVDDAVARLEAGLGAPLRSLDPARHLALLLVDGAHGDEEAVTERLGNAAPVLDVVGGSAGDDLAFRRTVVAVGDRVSGHGAALVVIETGVEFRVVKTASFRPSGKRLRVTRTDAGGRVVLEFDHLPAVEAYAHALGIETDCVDDVAFMNHPVALMIDGEPWVRSPHATTPEGGIAFLARMSEGFEVEIVDAVGVVGDTRRALRAAVDDLGGRAGGAVMFNCVLRRLRLDADGEGDAFVAAFDGVPTAGFHTYGETWLGHVNATLTGVVLGADPGRPAAGSD